MLRANAVLNEAQHHTKPRDAESQMPVDSLTEKSGDDRRDTRAEVDPHVENRKPGVAPSATLRIQPADHRRHARLEEAGARHDQNEREIERRLASDGHREVAEG